LALISDDPRSAAVTTLAPCEFLVIERPAFLDLITSCNVPVLFGILDTLVSKIQIISNKYFKEELAKQAIQHEMELASHRAMTQMVAGVAHEMNTPLGTANTAVSILQRVLTSPSFAALRQDSQVNTDLEDALEALHLVER